MTAPSSLVLPAGMLAANAPKLTTARRMIRLAGSSGSAKLLASSPAATSLDGISGEGAGVRGLADEPVGRSEVDLRRLARCVHQQAVRVVERSRAE